jgi:hypothetical protein
MNLLADMVVAVHFLWIVFLLLGALAGVRSRWVRWFHGGALGFAVLMQVMGWYCPLTHLEFWLRGGRGRPGSFIVAWLERLVYLEVSPRAVLAGTLILVALNLCVYWRAGRRKHGTC